MIAGRNQGIRALTMVTETLNAGQAHHHHTMTCEECGSWWFDDIVTGGLGLPVPARRDTMLYDCPENDGADRYVHSIVQAPYPESECHCTAADVERYAIPVRLRG